MAQQQPQPVPAPVPVQQQQLRRETTPMDSLQGTMNLLLTVLGQSLNQPARLRDPQQRIKMQGVFPTANLRFHEALDRMEDEIQAAQWILKRDLAFHRVREQKKKAETVQSKREVGNTASATSGAGVGVKKETGLEDIVMLDSDATEEKPTAGDAQATMEKTEPKQETPPPAPTAPSMVAPSAAAPSTDQTQPTAAAAPSTDQTQPTAAAEEPSSLMDDPTGADHDFSDIFGDGDLGDAGAEDNDDAAHLDELPDFGDAGLLPGIESYASIPDEDTGMHDVVTATTSAPEAPTASGTAGASTAAVAAGGGDTEFNFGDFTTNQGDSNDKQDANDDGQPDFGDIDFGGFDTGDAGGAGGSGGGGDGGMQDVDNTFNDLFDMDDYGFGGGGDDGKGVQDVDDWMNSL